MCIEVDSVCTGISVYCNGEELLIKLHVMLEGVDEIIQTKTGRNFVLNSNLMFNNIYM